jgi:hypothetical protein
MFKTFVILLSCAANGQACVEDHVPVPGQLTPLLCPAAIEMVKGDIKNPPGWVLLKSYCQDERPGPAYGIYKKADGSTTNLH